MDDQRPEKSSSASFVSVAVIDIADNNPDYSESNSAVTRANKTTRSGSSNKPLSLVCSHCRGKKKGGGSIAGIDGGIGHTMGGRRNEVRREVHLGNNHNMGAGLRIRCLYTHSNPKHIARTNEGYPQDSFATRGKEYRHRLRTHAHTAVLHIVDITCSVVVNFCHVFRCRSIHIA